MKIEVTGLESIAKRMRAFPKQFNKHVKRVMQMSLLKIWESIPGYPKPPKNSKYVRQGTLGSSLGVSMTGGMEGKPDIYKIQGSGRYTSAEFGTRLNYAQDVIGNNQAEIHKKRWWRLTVEILNMAKPKIQKVFDELAEDFAEFLDGKGR